MPLDTSQSLTSSASPPVSSYLASPSPEETDSRKNVEKTEQETVGVLRDAAKQSQSYLDHLGNAPDPEEYGLGKKDLEEMKPTKGPEYKPDNPLQDFGGVASLIGIFGGMLTRRPLVASLNAASGAMKAYHQRNIEDYDKQVEEWKNNTDFISKTMDWREKAYEMADKQYSGNLQKWQAANQAIAARSQDFMSMDAIQKGEYDRLYQIRMDNARLKMQMDDQFVKMQDLAEKQRHDLATEGKSPTLPQLQGQSATLRMQAASLPDGDPKKSDLTKQADNIDKSIEASNETSKGNVIGDDAATLTARRVLAGDPRATANMSRSQQNMKKVEDEVARIAKDEHMTERDIIVAQSLVRSDQSSLTNMTKMADAAISFEKTANYNLDLALSLAPKGIPTTWGPYVNKWIESGLTGTGDADVPPYVAALLTGANEYAKIMAGSTGAQGSTVDSRREAAEIISPYLSKNQITNVVKVLKQDMSNRKGSLTEQIGDIKDRLGGTSGPSGSAPTKATLNGRQIEVRNGKWVYSDDGAEVQE